VNKRKVNGRDNTKCIDIYSVVNTKSELLYLCTKVSSVGENAAFRAVSARQPKVPHDWSDRFMLREFWQTLVNQRESSYPLPYWGLERSKA
jgi:hypothetical protein